MFLAFSIYKKPVDCSVDMFDDGNRKRRSEEFPLIAQLSTSIQITVIETYDEQNGNN